MKDLLQVFVSIYGSLPAGTFEQTASLSGAVVGVFLIKKLKYRTVWYVQLITGYLVSIFCFTLLMKVSSVFVYSLNEVQARFIMGATGWVVANKILVWLESKIDEK